MDITSYRFLSALKCSLLWEKVDWEEKMENQDWVDLFKMAEQHHVLPMIYEAVYDCPSARQADPQLFMQYKRRVMQMVMLQTMKTSEFLMLYKHLEASAIQPIVVKGIVCRNLYPNPDYRISGDEDVLISPEQFAACHQAMTEYGMQQADPDLDMDKAYEVPYGSGQSPLYIELHKSLFPPESDAYGDFNQLFEGIWERTISRIINCISIRTLGHTDHLFYLICHAFKHFLHSGFGLRQVCDIILYANCFGREVEWPDIMERCRKINADLFAAALFKIGEKYLTFDKKKACWPEEWQHMAVDEGPLLEDLLDSGVYGGASMSRKHSSTMTLNAVADTKHGRKGGNSVLRTVFPPVKSLKGRYTYLEKYPWMLPAAWFSRILKYGREIKNGDGRDNAVTDAVKIGNERIELMKQYRIIK